MKQQVAVVVSMNGVQQVNHIQVRWIEPLERTNRDLTGMLEELDALLAKSPT